MRSGFKRLVGHLSMGQDHIYIYILGVIYRRDRESERRVGYRGRGGRLRAVNKDDRTTCIKCGPDRIVFVVAYVLYTQ